jgi:hypothetical protein
MSRYEIYTGKFPCHTCREVVTSLRMYSETKQVTWMCSQKHMSSVVLVASKKTKKDYE